MPCGKRLRRPDLRHHDAACYDLAHALRKLEQDDPSRVATPTLAVSGDALKPSRKRRFADFQVYMAKPFNEPQLVHIVERLAEADSEGVRLGTLASWDEANRKKSLDEAE